MWHWPICVVLTLVGVRMIEPSRNSTSSLDPRTIPARSRSADHGSAHKHLATWWSVRSFSSSKTTEPTTICGTTDGGTSKLASCDVYPDFSDVYMNSSGNTELSHKNGIHKSKRCYTSGFRREPTCYFFANAVKRQTHGRRKRSPANPQSKNSLRTKPSYTPTLAPRLRVRQRTIRQSCLPIRHKLPR